ncbi:hypothetical protein ADIS_3169 [Lunatimonas lonarensis]|uniref:Glycosyltransferase RgtA/B/C/D-like domain-containing protein n=1 Tax=Lunatimonas lonarensis TaxID=1232681 RepID=R7ZPJ5_9BACT|nr:hypothetical protein [Lunatimonas lonarensis]EON76041.1 hypothetical protein ADIS_3169 [Lunatimonas lonarensis]
MPGTAVRLVVLLLLYHLLFTVLFHHYLLTHGGDSIAYWQLSITNYRPALGWMDYFEYGNFFMQWLTYVPARVMGLSYLTGNLLFSLVGFLGFVELLRLGLTHWGWEKGSLLKNAWVLALFIPSAHFWTAGVGKEAVLWLGTIWVLKGNTNLWKNGHWLLLGLFLTGMTRPIHGAVLILITTVYQLQDRKILNSPFRWPVIALSAVGGAFLLYILLRQTHLSAWSLAAIYDFFNSQLEFLAGFQAGSYIPMHEYTWPVRLWTVLFRPHLGESVGIWRWAAALENSFLLLLSLTALGTGVWKRTLLNPPHFVLQGLILGIAMLLLYSVTLNNLGIITRMKSILLPFFGLLWLPYTALIKKKVIFGGN